MSNVFLKCGCTANAKRLVNGSNPELWVPSCSLHGETEQVEAVDLSNRQARCSYGDTITNSDAGLAFFKVQLDKTHDSYYCGCKGWD